MSARTNTKRIALISATPAAIDPAVAGLADAFPEAEPWNLLDDTLLSDADARGGLTDALAARMRRLIAYAVEGGAHGVLLTCSLYGPVTGTVTGSVTRGVPVLAPDTAAFGAALAGGHRRILVLASFEAALNDSLARFRAAAGGTVEAVGALTPSGGEPPDTHGADAVLLAQYSLAPYAGELAERLGLPVHSGPHAAARALKTALSDGSSS